MTTTSALPLTSFALEVLRAAQRSARDRGHSQIALEDAVVGTLATGRAGVGARALLDSGVTLATAERLASLLPSRDLPAASDAEVLAGVGIDLDDLRRRLTDSLGQELSLADRTVAPSEQLTAAIYFGLDEAEHLGHKYFGTEHLVLGLVAHDARAGTDLLDRLGASSDGVRSSVMQNMAFIAFFFAAVGDRSPWEDVEVARRRVARLTGASWDTGMRLVQVASTQIRTALERAYDAEWPTIPADVGVAWERHLTTTATSASVASADRDRAFDRLRILPDAVWLASRFGAAAREAVQTLQRGVDELITTTT